VTVDVTVSYASDLAIVEDVTLEVARDTAQRAGRGEPVRPQVRFQAFADIGVRLSAVLRAQAFVDQFALKHEFIKRLHRRYGDESIEVAWLRSGVLGGSDVVR
jgi:small-conductance mechanosensitive channel